jgi:hypothetical protein
VGRYFGRINGYSVGFDEGYSAGSAIRRNKVGTTFQKKLVKTSVRQKNNKKIIQIDQFSFAFRSEMYYDLQVFYPELFLEGTT